MAITDPILSRAYQAERRQRFFDAGKCRCGRDRADGLKRCAKCIAADKRYCKTQDIKRKASGLCRQCGRPVETLDYCRCSSCRDVARRHLQKLKRETIDSYGGRCACCGETEFAFLTIDHINNDGKKHRDSIKTNRVYSWLKKHGFPKESFQCLCFNCNCGRRVNGGVCPHLQ